MNKQYFENWFDKIKNGEDENMTQEHRKLCYMYDRMVDDECDWMALNSADNVQDAVEFVRVMKEADLSEVYIREEWSNQFAHWYEWQKAGLKMCGIVEVDNPKFVKQIQMYGESRERPTILLLKFSL